jgi:hypothetical protein
LKEETNISKKNPFKTPESYFDTLPEKLTKKINDEKERTSYKRTFDIFKPYIYMAAGLLALAFLMKSGLNLLVDKEDVLKSTNSEITYNEDDTMLESLLSDDYLFYTYINNNDAGNVSDFTSEELEEYILCFNNIEYDIFFELE